MKPIFPILQSKIGHDFSSYKTSTIHRRIARRMAVHQVHHFSDYVKVMSQDPSEPNRLLKDMLIGVTSFFRYGASLQDDLLTLLVRSSATTPTSAPNSAAAPPPTWCATRFPHH